MEFGHSSFTKLLKRAIHMTRRSAEAMPERPTMPEMPTNIGDKMKPMMAEAMTEGILSLNLYFPSVIYEPTSISTISATKPITS